MVDQLRTRWWLYAWFAAAVAYAVPICVITYDKVIDVTQKRRAQLIVEHRLWELHPEYRGTPEQWTRFASRLLTDRQLAMRLRTKYGERAEQFELDYLRDLTIAQGEVIIVALAIWGGPAGLVYGLAWAFFGRPRRAPPVAAPARPVYDESRYRPPP